MVYHGYNKNDPYLRRAMYEISGKKCAYCGEFIQPNNMQIDHILASKSKKSNDLDFNNYIDELCGNGFVLDSIENYNVCCPHCNQSKNNRNFQTSNLRYFHDKALKAVDKILKRIEKLKINPINFPNYNPDFDNWEKIDFSNQRDITHAIRGYRLSYNDVETCPRLLHVEKIKNRILDVNYCFVSGEPGSGKSISIYQAAFDLYKEGWTIYNFINCEKNCFVLPSFLEQKVMLIIDDSQNLQSKDIDKLRLQSNSNIKMIFGCTKSKDFIPEETLYLSNSESINLLKDYYLKHDIEFTKIIARIDKSIGFDSLQTPLSFRVNKAANAKTPWEFNYIIRGEWNSIKQQYEMIKEQNNCEVLVSIIAIIQILFLDSPLNIDIIKKGMHIYDDKIEWSYDDINYLISKKLITSGHDLRIVHLETAKRVVSLFIDDHIKDVFSRLRNLLKYLYLNEKISYLGLIWLNDSFGNTNYSITNLYTDEIMDLFFELEKKTLDDQEKGYSLYLMSMLSSYEYHGMKNYYIHKNKKIIIDWISNANDSNVYCYMIFLNNILNNSSLVHEITNKIDILNMMNNSKNFKIENAYTWGKFINKFYYVKNDELKINIYNKFKKITDIFVSEANELNIKYLLYYLSQIRFMNNEDVSNIVLNNIDYIKKYVNNDVEFYIDLFSDYELIDLIGWYFLEYKPDKYAKKVSKVLLKLRNEDKLIDFINNSAPRYWNHIYRFYWIFRYYDKEGAIEFSKKVDVSKNLYVYEYLDKTNDALFYLFSVAFDGALEKNKAFLIHHKSEINELFLPFVKFVPDLAIDLFNNNKKIILFANGWHDEEIKAIKKLTIIDSLITLKILESNEKEFVKQLEEIHYFDFNNQDGENLNDLADFLIINYNDYFTKCVNLINSYTVIKNVYNMLNEYQYNSFIKKRLLALLHYYKSIHYDGNLFDDCISKVKKFKIKRNK